MLIVDWDVHHGNGTEEIFDSDPSVFYFSTHQKGIYPGTGLEEDIGKGEAKGTKLNVPIEGGVGSRERVFQAFLQKLIPAMKKFQPEFVFISCGFDGHKEDPLGGFDLTDADFFELTTIVKNIASSYYQKPGLYLFLKAATTSLLFSVQALSMSKLFVKINLLFIKN